MIIQETIELNGKEYIHTYSNSNFYIQKEGTEEIYAEAYDIPESTFTYIETSTPIEIDEETELKLTRGDVFRGLLRAKGITKDQIKILIEAMPSNTEEERLAKQLALIDFEDSLYFYRRNPLLDKIGQQLEITAEQMTKFFITNDYTKLNEEF